MAIRFAGSRSLDERRRRRLARELDDVLQTAIGPKTTQICMGDDAKDYGRASSKVTLPLQNVILQRIWKHWVIGLLGLTLVVGILVGGFYESQGALAAGPGFSWLFAFSTARLATFFSTAFLLVSCQLALLIWWMRSRSKHDFSGQYRVWVWTTVIWFAFACSVATDGHLAVSQTILWLCDLRLWNFETLCWLVPATIVGTVLLWAMYRDMRSCRSSVTMLFLAAFLYLLSAVSALELLVMSNGHWNVLFRVGTGVSGHLALLMSMLLHARYVIYESAEPPEPRPSRLIASFHRLWQPKSQLMPSDGITKLNIDSESAIERKNLSRVDLPIDKSQLKGLSKRDRQRLRKQWREQQRASHEPQESTSH